MDARGLYRLARTLWREGAAGPSHPEATFISCTNLPTIDIIADLEQDTGAPVVTSNQATLWASLRVLGCRQPVLGYGALLETAL